MAIEFKSVFGNTDKETLAGLRDKFKNTALWDYLPVAIPFFFHEVNSWDEELSKDTRSGVQKYIDETLELVQLLRSLKLGKAKGTGWRLESRSDIQRLYDSVESLFFEKLDNLTHVLHKYEWEDYSSELFSDWEEALSAFPRTELFQKEDRKTDEVNIEMEDGKPRLSIDEIESAIITIKKCKKIADRFYLPSDDALAKRFVAHMIEKGVPESRAMYRCFYDMLDCFGGIPYKTKSYHQNLPPNSYPKSNYIKAIASRYHKQRRKATQS